MTTSTTLIILAFSLISNLMGVQAAMEIVDRETEAWEAAAFRAADAQARIERFLGAIDLNDEYDDDKAITVLALKPTSTQLGTRITFDVSRLSNSMRKASLKVLLTFKSEQEDKEHEDVFIVVGVGHHDEVDQEVLVWPPTPIVYMDPKMGVDLQFEVGHVLRPLLFDKSFESDKSYVDLTLHVLNRSYLELQVLDASLELHLVVHDHGGDAGHGGRGKRVDKDIEFEDKAETLVALPKSRFGRHVARRVGCERIPMDVDLSLSLELKSVLAPRSFDAGACTGSCPSGHDFNWHAFLQNLMSLATSKDEDEQRRVRPTRCAPAVFSDAMIIVAINRGQQRLKVAQLKDALVKECACI